MPCSLGTVGTGVAVSVAVDLGVDVGTVGDGSGDDVVVMLFLGVILGVIVDNGCGEGVSVTRMSSVCRDNSTMPITRSKTMLAMPTMIAIRVLSGIGGDGFAGNASCISLAV